MNKLDTFEDNIKTLEQIVKDLEKGDLPLKEALSEFETGIQLFSACKEVLNEVDAKIKIIENDLENGTFKLQPFFDEGE